MEGGGGGRDVCGLGAFGGERWSGAVGEERFVVNKREMDAGGPRGQNVEGGGGTMYGSHGVEEILYFDCTGCAPFHCLMF